MTREQEISESANKWQEALEERNPQAEAWVFHLAFEAGARWADSHPSDETIMRILNCIGYEEESWIDFVRKRLDSNGTM